ncbi:D-3-phosphoglycerate dehydrogenase / 2-oxoglutarate reductase [Candidatus Hakubella thermalkaliphila]|uniref:D-3-phosphoglycerate dehydrogenase n=2 Tax=Candidatus Hakubella thermalkaliphila TaxID=2754717 RepID=A0A6V8QF72_9ACTN|nr:phosphoglycerate dehydrogenase [Candidatus Hakubella thermalkaliphila]GFP18516.1 D-3-phosphoglycerate dehydrogenase / 2-oxoglutarate reductase [Candidatus Hakubella thermalkaliphila]GFP22543.1 D-3-phosphoglycerate dehydrogenase / 2-oxoglutarate reductase [Candidatus Hakubella thermalkaliphila]GFP41986.1 D-3-phosphoglycerate dehydrogenase / 2-oxoglutarate reductase [Candidatus Hakubella thermalkaliphila]
MIEALKVLVKEEISAKAIALLKEHFEVQVMVDLSRDALKEIISQYDGLIIRSETRVDEELLERATRLKVIGRAGVGLDNIDLEAATKRGIIVTNAPQSNVVSAAEHAIALLMSLCRYVPQANASLKGGAWERSKFKGIEVQGKYLGIAGLGRVGTLVAQKASGLGMKVIAHDPYVSEERFHQLGISRARELKDLFEVSDFITIHLPKTKDTYHMFGRQEFQAMKRGVLLINVARGSIVDTEALVEALESGQVGGAALDVFEEEPCTDSPLFKSPQVVVTPHLGASTIEAQDKAGVVIAEQVRAALLGEPVTNAVNVPAASPEVMEVLSPFFPLAEKLGGLMVRLYSGRLNTLGVEYSGQVAEYDTRLLTLAILKGMFDKFVEEHVNYVNAPLIAKERGIEVRESKTRFSRDYVNLITLKAENAETEFSVSGTVLGKRNVPRFVSIDKFMIDMVPSKYMAFFRYKDVPGRIGIIGTILGRNNINIANMQVGRKKIEGDAMTAINTDSPIPEEVMEEIRQQLGIEEARFIEL